MLRRLLVKTYEYRNLLITKNWMDNFAIKTMNALPAHNVN